MSDQQISKTILLRFHWFEGLSKIHALFDKADAVSAVGICSLDKILSLLLWFTGLLSSATISWKQKYWLENFCHILGRLQGCWCAPQFVPLILPRALVALIYHHALRL
jgi:hypothetical protein